MRGLTRRPVSRARTAWALRGLSPILTPASGEDGQVPFDSDNYSEVLKIHIDDERLAHWRGLKARPRELNTFLRRIGDLDRATYDTCTEKEKTAFWVDGYNVITLKAIVSNCPIKSSWTKSLKYSKNSIRQISGVWDKLKFRVSGLETTLDERSRPVPGRSSQSRYQGAHHDVFSTTDTIPIRFCRC